MDIDPPGPRSPHDMGLTENYAILHDLPLFHDVEFLKTMVAADWRFTVICLRGLAYCQNQDLANQWFECEPCYILHVVNAWEEGDWVHQVGCRQANPTPVGSQGPASSINGISTARSHAAPMVLQYAH